MTLALGRLSILLRRSSQGLHRRARRSGGLVGSTIWREVDGGKVGLFLGFVTDGSSWADLEPEPPEAVVFAFVNPVGSRLHRRLVARTGSLFERVGREARRRKVDFEFRRDRFAALLRHRSVHGMPPEILALTAQDFFTISFRGLWAANFFDRIKKVRPSGSRRGG